jgi:hypothetical protein
MSVVAVDGQTDPDDKESPIMPVAGSGFERWAKRRMPMAGAISRSRHVLIDQVPSAAIRSTS